MDDLALAQQRLGRALDKARAGEDRQLAQQVREAGEQVANLLNGLLRMTRVHAPENKAFDQPVVELQGAIARLLELLGTIHLVAVGDQTYINEIRIRSGAKGKADLGGELAIHNIGGITFHLAPTEPQLRKILGLLGAKPAAADRRGTIERALQAAGVEGLELTPVHRFRMADEVVEQAPRTALEIAAQALAQLEESFRNLTAGRQPNVLPLRRVVAELCKVGPGAEELWAGLPAAPPQVTHAFRVCQYVLLMGQAAGLADGILQDLGVAALLHDAGYAFRGQGGSVPSYEAHPAAGARVLLRQLGFHEAKVRRTLAALQHHQDARSDQGKPTLFARAIRIAEDLDTMIRPAGGNLSPTMALCTMVPSAGTRYDPVLLQLLVNRLGYYPPGSHLLLEDGRIVRTVSLVRGPESFTTPRAVVLREAGGAVPAAPVVVDLATEGKAARLVRAPA